MQHQHNILIFGASYGSLLGTKLALAGHAVHLVCLPAEVELINTEGALVRMPIKGSADLLEIGSKRLPGKITAGGPHGVDVAKYDLIALAMQEPQYRATDVRELLCSVAKNHVPCMSIMNMPPLPYLRRIPGVDADACRKCYTDPAVWDSFEPALMTLCSPDPQAFRPPGEKANVLQVRLPTNFKAARFESDRHTALLHELAGGIDAARFTTSSDSVELPVRLRIHESVFVPLAKWAMLIAGNYRCVREEGIVSIRDAVHSDIDASRIVYEWVVDLCARLGADKCDLVPFDKYANAALSLTSPSSAARALFAGASEIERIDLLVQTIAAQKGMRLEALDAIVARVGARLNTNRHSRGEAAPLTSGARGR